MHGSTCLSVCVMVVLRYLMHIVLKFSASFFAALAFLVLLIHVLFRYWYSRLSACPCSVSRVAAQTIVSHYLTSSALIIFLFAVFSVVSLYHQYFSFILPSFKFSSPSTHVSSACIDVKDTIIYVLKSSVNAGGNATNRCGASLVHQEFIATTCVSDFRICVWKGNIFSLQIRSFAVTFLCGNLGSCKWCFI